MQNINVVVIETNQKNKNVLTTLLGACTDAHIVSMNATLHDANDQVYWENVHVLLIGMDEYEQGKANELKTLVNKYALPVIVVAENNVYEARRIVQAISSGASDYYVMKDTDTPVTILKQEEVLSSKLKYATRQQKKKQKRNVLMNQTQTHYKLAKPSKVERTRNNTTIPNLRKSSTLIAIGTSTGGPKALEVIIRSLPKEFPTPIVIVQHMPAKFTASLAARLNTLGTIAVKEAEDGDWIENGTAYIAPGDYHLEVRKVRNRLMINLHQEAPRAGHRPSVDVMLESIAMMNDIHKIIVILTGMGKDGARGIQRVKQVDPNACVIAESKKTTVVNGMPSAAIDTNHVTDVIRIEQIGQALVDQL